MKKIPSKLQAWFVKRNQLGLKKIKKFRKLITRKKQTELLAERLKKHGSRTTCKKTIRAPVVFDVCDGDKRSVVLTFLKNINEALVKGVHVRICFSETKELHACGTLVFSAHLDVWLHSYAHLLTCNYPKNNVVEQLFQHIGILERLGLSNRTVVTDDKVKFWHHYSGDLVTASDYKPLTLSIVEHVDAATKTLFADCLNEAVTNTVNHAYDYKEEVPGLPPKELRKWWIFSQVKDGFLFVAIYDRGMSIPVSLLIKPEIKEVAWRVLPDTDGKLIEAAVSSDRTRTRLDFRGNGLPEMLEFCQSMDAGALTILSRKGAFNYEAKVKRQKRTKYVKPLPGTLVLWRIPFLKGE